MTTAFFTGFFLGLSLIIAIGAQNTFVLRQGILRQHIFIIALFCSVSDALLIILGVVGISYFLNDFIAEYSKIIFGLSSLWLFSYGTLRLRSAFKSNSIDISNNSSQNSLLNSISIVSAFTFLNPHVYLDTIVLIGSISQQFIDFNRIYFTIGACLASFIWFFVIAYGAQLLTPMMQKPRHWRILVSLIAIVMFIIGFNLAAQGGWL